MYTVFQEIWTNAHNVRYTKMLLLTLLIAKTSIKQVTEVIEILNVRLVKCLLFLGARSFRSLVRFSLVNISETMKQNAIMLSYNCINDSNNSKIAFAIDVIKVSLSEALFDGAIMFLKLGQPMGIALSFVWLHHFGINFLIMFVTCTA